MIRLKSWCATIGESVRSPEEKPPCPAKTRTPQNSNCDWWFESWTVVSSKTKKTRTWIRWTHICSFSPSRRTTGWCLTSTCRLATYRKIPQLWWKSSNFEICRPRRKPVKCHFWCYEKQWNCERSTSSWKMHEKKACHAKHICITKTYWLFFNLPFVKSSSAGVCLHTSEMGIRRELN